MTPVKIYQFTERDALEVRGEHHPTCGKLVSLRQFVGSCHFQFSMSPRQAREMAAALVAHADALEA